MARKAKNFDEILEEEAEIPPIAEAIKAEAAEKIEPEPEPKPPVEPEVPDEEAPEPIPDHFALTEFRWHILGILFKFTKHQIITDRIVLTHLLRGGAPIEKVKDHNICPACAHVYAKAVEENGA